MSQSLEHYRTKPDSKNDKGQYYTCMIQEDPQSHNTKLTYFRTYPGYSGTSETDSYTFEDTNVLLKAIEELHRTGTAQISAPGTHVHSYESWDHSYDLSGDDVHENNEEKGLITCTLLLVDGQIAPFTAGVVRSGPKPPPAPWLH